MKTIPFKNFITFQRGFDLPKDQMVEGPYPVVGSTSIIGRHEEYKVIGPGVVTGRSGSLGFLQYIRDDYWPHNTALWVKDFKGNHPAFVYYFLHTLNLERFNSGVGVPTLNRNDLDTLNVTIPEPETQRRIASILSAYDDLIENNTRRIKILEDMARLIYREWFVEFRVPGVRLRKATPEEKKVTGKDVFPEGWELCAYENLLDSTMGGDWGEEEPNEKEDSPVLVIRGTDFDEIRSGNELRSPLRYISADSLVKRQLKIGDIIVENSVNAKSRCVGQTILITAGVLKRRTEDMIAASFCKVFRLKEPSLSPLIALHMKRLYETKEMEYYQNVATNGIGNFQSTRFVEKVCIPLPLDKENLKIITDIISNLTSTIYADLNSNLRRTRDLLLPKLIGGELEVRINC